MRILPLLCLFVAVPSLTACDLCSVYSASEANGSGKGYFAGVASQFTEFGTLQSDGSEISGNGEYIDSFITQIFGGCNFNKFIGVQLNVPLIYRAYGDNSHDNSVGGIGDISLVANVALIQKMADDWTFSWTALAGIKLPTGDSSELNTPDSALPEGIGGHDIALGSGSFDGLLGTGFYARWKRAFFSGQMQYGIRSEGDFRHQYANDWTWSGGPGVYLALADRYTLSLQVECSGETKGHDTFDGTQDPDSAETIVYLGPTIAFTWLEDFSAHVGVDIPVSRENTGTQVMPDYRVHAATTWRF